MFEQKWAEPSRLKYGKTELRTLPNLGLFTKNQTTNPPKPNKITNFGLMNLVRLNTNMITIDSKTYLTLSNKNS